MSTIVFIGDSITDCRRREDPEALGAGYVRLLAEQFSRHGGTTVINTGVSGDTVPDVAARLQEDCLGHQPDLVSLYVGVNDTWRRFSRNQPTSVEEFEEGYRGLLDRIAPLPTMVVIPFIVDANEEVATYHEDLDGKVAVIRKLAAERNLVVVDLEAAMADALQGHEPAELAADGIHPTPMGHEILAETWLNAYNQGREEGRLPDLAA